MNYLYENYQKDLKNYDQSSELLQKLSNSTDKIKNLLYDDELSEIMTREQKDFLIINKKISRKLSNSLFLSVVLIIILSIKKQLCFLCSF